MPTMEVTPKNLRPYRFLGIDLAFKEGDREAHADCPFCGKERKFSVNAETGQWCCWVCCPPIKGESGGNPLTFMRRLWDESDKATNGETAVLAAERKLLYPDTLTRWGVVQSFLTKEWLVPGFSADGRLIQLYAWRPEYGKGRMRLWPTPEVGGHGIHMVKFGSLPTVWVCEGPWDGMALWELAVKRHEGVVAVPGCGSVGEPFKRWLPLLKGRRVILAFDSDRPREHNGRRIEPAGFSATKRAAAMLSGVAKDVRWVAWGREGFDPARPDGFDVRDLLSAGEDESERSKLLAALMDRVGPLPEAVRVVAGSNGRMPAPAKAEGSGLEPIACSSWHDLLNAWRTAFHWFEGLERGLVACLATAASTKTPVDQLWIKLIGPPGCGKSTIAEGMAIAKRYVLAKSTVRGLHSGYRETRSKDEDNSLMIEALGMTLIFKDADSVLKAPDLMRILSEFRDAYDKVARTSYRNQASKDYENHCMTVIFCGTKALRALDQSELGERCVDVVVMEDIDAEMEGDAVWQVVNRTDRALSFLSNGDGGIDHHREVMGDPAIERAQQLTAGYVEYLRVNAKRLLTRVRFPEIALRQCSNLAIFTSHMRARPSKEDDSAGREMSTRLVVQLATMAKCIAVVLGKVEVDEAVMRHVHRVAMDTSRGQSLKVVRYLYKTGREGVSVSALAIDLSETDVKARNLLYFLRVIGAVEPWVKKLGRQVTRTKWRLTERMRDLYKEVSEHAEHFARS